MQSDTIYSDYLIKVIRPFLSSPEEVKIDQKADEMGILLTLQVGQADMGKIIGKEGATARSLRTLLGVYGGTHKARISLKIEEPIGSTHRSRPRNIQ